MDERKNANGLTVRIVTGDELIAQIRDPPIQLVDVFGAQSNAQAHCLYGRVAAGLE